MIAIANVERPVCLGARAALEQTPTEMSELALELCDLFARRDAEAIVVRHQIGQKVVEAKTATGGVGGGDAAVRALAELIDRRQRTLSDCGKIAEQWTGDEIEEIAARRDASGKALVWQHLRVLSGEEFTDQERRAWIETSFRECLSFRQLRERVLGLRYPLAWQVLRRLFERQRELHVEFAGQNKRLASALDRLPKLNLLQQVEVRDGLAIGGRLRKLLEERLDLLNEFAKQFLDPTYSNESTPPSSEDLVKVCQKAIVIQ